MDKLLYAAALVMLGYTFLDLTSGIVFRAYFKAKEAHDGKIK